MEHRVYVNSHAKQITYTHIKHHAVHVKGWLTVEAQVTQHALEGGNKDNQSEPP